MDAAGASVAAYIGRWRPSSVPPQAASFARDVIAKTGPQGRERAKNLLWAAGKLADYALGLGLDLAPEVVLHPSVAERFTRCAPGLSGVARRTLRTNLRFIGRRVVPQLYPADLPLPRERAKQPYSPAQIGGFLALADAQPTTARRMRAAGPGLPRGGSRADPRRPARGAGGRRGAPVRRGRGHRPRRPAARSAGAGPLPRAAAGRRPVRRDGAGLRRGRSGPPEHHEPAGSRAGRRRRAAPAGHLPAARHLAAPTALTSSVWRRSCTRPGSAAPSGSAISSPGWNRPATPRRCGCSAAAGDDPAWRRSGADHRCRRRGAADRGACCPIGVRARQLSVRTLLAGMCLAQADQPAGAPDPGAPGPDQPARRGAAAAGRPRGLEARPAPADLPADRVHLRPRRQDALGQGRRPTGCPRRPAAGSLR